MSGPLAVVLRSRNDMPLVAETLRMLDRQSRPLALTVLDNASSDGTREEALRHTSQVETIPEGTYVPGRVLNLGLRLTAGEWVVFLNSDCTPVDDEWLARLERGFADGVAAVFGRQAPRPGCWTLHARDTEAIFGDGARQQAWRHCFSMASSAIRRSVWETMPFSETLQYSEDVDWSWRARQQGWEIRYVPDATVLHSHNYTLAQSYRRHRGEGRAEARIFPWTAWEASLLRYTLLPLFRRILSDWAYCLRRGRMDGVFHSPFLRAAQLTGRRVGFRQGLREKAREEKP